MRFGNVGAPQLLSHGLWREAGVRVFLHRSFDGPMTGCVVRRNAGRGGPVPGSRWDVAGVMAAALIVCGPRSGCARTSAAKAPGELGPRRANSRPRTRFGVVGQRNRSRAPCCRAAQFVADAPYLGALDQNDRRDIGWFWSTPGSCARRPRWPRWTYLRVSATYDRLRRQTEWWFRRPGSRG